MLMKLFSREELPAHLMVHSSKAYMYVRIPRLAILMQYTLYHIHMYIHRLALILVLPHLSQDWLSPSLSTLALLSHLPPFLPLPPWTATQPDLADIMVEPSQPEEAQGKLLMFRTQKPPQPLPLPQFKLLGKVLEDQAERERKLLVLLL